MDNFQSQNAQWIRKYDNSSGYHYYLNKITGESKWDETEYNTNHKPSQLELNIKETIKETIKEPMNEQTLSKTKNEIKNEMYKETENEIMAE